MSVITKTRAGSLTSRRSTYERVLTRSQRTGQWQPISRYGFAVVCASRLESRELIWRVAPQMVGELAGMPVDDDGYVDYLIGRFFIIEPYVPSSAYELVEFRNGVKGYIGAFEMSFNLFIKGWSPQQAVDAALAQGGLSDLMSAAFRAKNAGR